LRCTHSNKTTVGITIKNAFDCYHHHVVRPLNLKFREKTEMGNICAIAMTPSIKPESQGKQSTTADKMNRRKQSQWQLKTPSDADISRQ
jgi:hypothetical protein